MKRTAVLALLAIASVAYAGTRLDRHCDFQGHIYDPNDHSCAVYSNWYLR